MSEPTHSTPGPAAIEPATAPRTDQAAAGFRLAEIACTAVALLVPLLYLPSLEAPFVAAKMAVLELGAALAFAAWALRRAPQGGPGRPGSVAAAAMLVVATTVASWAVAGLTAGGTSYAVPALARWLALFGIAAGASVIGDDPRARQRLLEVVTVAAAAVSAIGIVQHLEWVAFPIPVISAPGATFGNRNLAAELVALSLPLGLAAALAVGRGSQRIALGGLLALQLIYLGATRARGAWLGGAAGLALVLLLARPRLPRSRRTRALIIGAAALALCAGLLPGRINPRHTGDGKRFASGAEVVRASFDPQSIALRTRFGLWRRTAKMVRDYMVWGVGPGNWPVMFPRYAEPGATQDGILSATLAPRQAHDDLLERAAETGLAGTAALLLLAAAVVRAARRRLGAADQPARVAIAGAAGTLMALVGVGLTGFPLEMPGTLAVAGLGLGLITGPGGARPGPVAAGARRARVMAPLLVALIGVVIAGARAQRDLRSSHWLGQAERMLRRDPGPDGAARALAALARAPAGAPDAFRIRLRTAQMQVRLHRPSEAVPAAELALALEPDSPNAWATLAGAKLDAGDAAGAQAASRRALALLHDYPFALATSARAAQRLGDPAAAVRDWAELRGLLSAADPKTASAARELMAAHDSDLRAGRP